MNRYLFFDYTIETDLFIPELVEADSGDAGPAITISAGAPDVRYFEAVHRWMNNDVMELSCDRQDDWYRFESPDEVVTHIDTRNLRILYEADESLDEPTLRHFLIDQVLPRFIGHLGGLVLHGGCIANHAGSVVFLGDTGSGKSTLCASFLNDGWTVMSDDCLLLERGAVPHVRGAYSGLRLYPETISSLAMQDFKTSPMAAYSDKKRICTPKMVQNGGSPIKLVVSLGESESISVSTLGGAEAVMKLVSGSFSLAPGDSGLAADRVRRYAEIVNDGLPVVSCRFPREYHLLAEVKKSIIDTLVSVE